VTNTGETFQTNSTSISLPANATNITAFLSGSADGTEDAVVDDRATLVVNHGVAQAFDFETGCAALTPGRPAVSGLTAGVNTIDVALSDVCGGFEGSSPLWLVVGYTLRAPTEMDASATIADVLKPGASPLVVHVFDLVAHLTTTGGAPVPGRQVIFTSGTSEICRDTTDVNGFADCPGVPATLAAIISYRATFLGDATFLGSTDEVGSVTLGGANLL
jgi:hypothetical protein